MSCPYNVLCAVSLTTPFWQGYSRSMIHQIFTRYKYDDNKGKGPFLEGRCIKSLTGPYTWIQAGNSHATIRNRHDPRDVCRCAWVVCSLALCNSYSNNTSTAPAFSVRHEHQSDPTMYRCGYFYIMAACLISVWVCGFTGERRRCRLSSPSPDPASVCHLSQNPYRLCISLTMI